MTPRWVRRQEAIAAIAALPRDRTVFVGIDGRGGAGKSLFAADAAAAVPGAQVVHVDDFAGPHVPEWDWPRLRVELLDPLLAGRPGHYQRWEWNRDVPGEWCDVPVGRLVIIEGVSATRAELAAPWDLSVWVEAPRELRLARALERDGPAMMAHWLEVWMPSEEAYIAREHPEQRVDLIVSGAEDVNGVEDVSAR